MITKAVVANVVFTIVAGFTPPLVVWLNGAPENVKFCMYGLAVGLELGWWCCHYLANNRVAVETAKTARMAEEKAEKQRQWERDRQERLDAEEKARKDAVAAEEAKAIEDDRLRKAVEQAEADARKKRIESVQKRFEVNEDTLTLKKVVNADRYCIRCGHKNGVVSKLRNTRNGAWLCPTCGHEVQPPYIPPKSVADNPYF